MSRAVADPKRNSGIQSAIRAAFLIITGVCVLGSGCRDVATIWSAEATSPDGSWLATARTDQYGGPGTAAVLTTVYLKWAKGAQRPIQILGFSFHSAYASRTARVQMKWLTPSHLEVAYNGNDANLDFQVVKCGGVDISVRDVSSETRKASQ